MKVYDALKLAVERLERQEDPLPEEFRLTAAKLADRWTFCFAFLPLTPGKDVTVTVSAAGDVVVSWGI